MVPRANATAPSHIASASACADSDVLSSAHLGGVCEQDLQLISRYGVSWLYFTALFILPSAIKGVVYAVTCIKGQRIQSAPARVALTLLAFACVFCAALFLRANVSFIMKVDSDSGVTVPGQQYVAFLPTPSRAVDQFADIELVSNPEHSIDLALLFLFRLHRDRASASNIFEAALVGGVFEVLIPLLILLPVAAFIWFRRCLCGFDDCFKGTNHSSSGQSSRQSSSVLADTASTIGSGSISPLGRGMPSCIESSHIAIDILSKLGHMLVGGIRLLVLALVLALLAGFLLGPLVYTSLRQPGFGVLEHTGIEGHVPEGGEPSLPAGGLVEECPEVLDVVDHYVRHVLWADMRSSASGDRGFELKQSSLSHQVFGTVNVTSASNILWDMRCYIDPVEHLKSMETQGVVFPVADVLACDCSELSLYTEDGSHVLRCPEPSDIFQLLDRSGGPRQQVGKGSKLPGIKSMWVLALIGAFVLTVVQCTLAVYEAALVRCEGTAGSKLVESYHIQNTLTSYVLVVVFILIPCGFFVAWVKGAGLYEDREVVLGNVCVTKAPNLYAPELSRILGLLVAADLLSFLTIDVFFNHKLVADH